jgi:hypothetical protein
MHVRPEGFGALDFIGKALEAAQGDDLGPGAVNLSTMDLRALGRSLRRVAAGEDARHVFAQTRDGYTTFERLRRGTIAHLYWRTLAEVLATGDVTEREAKRLAIARAQKQFPDRDLDAASIVRYASTHRASCMMMLEHTHRVGKGPNPAALHAYLAKHSRKGKWTD